MNDLLLPAIQKSAQEIDPYYNLVSLHLKGDVNTGRNYNAFSDASSNNFRLTNNGDVRGSSFSPYGTSWSGFFGGGYITVPSGSAVTPTGTQSYCLEFFAYITGFSGTYDLFVEGSTNTNGFQIAYFNDGGASQGKLGVAASGVGSVNTATITGYLNKWVHVVATRSGNDHRLFFDGVLVAYASNAISFGARGTQAFGAQAAGTLPIDGYMSNIRVCLDAIPTSYQTSSTTVGTSVFSAVTSPLTTSSQGASSVALITCHTNRFIDRDNGTGTVALALNGTLRISSFSPFLETDTTSGSGYFDGSGDYLSIPGNSAFAFGTGGAGTGDFCLEAWVYPNTISTATFDRIVSTSDYNGSGFDWTLNTNSSSLFMSGTSYGIPNVITKAWNHIVYTRSSGVLRGFLNGVLVVYNASVTTNVSAVTELRIGVGYSGSHYNGYINGLRILKGSVPEAYQTSSTTTNTQIFTPPITSISAVTNTQLLTLQERGAYNTIGFEDESEYQHSITRNGNVAQGTFSPFSPSGWSVYLDGSATFTAPAGLVSAFAGWGGRTRTWECWIHRTSTATYSMQCAYAAVAANGRWYINITTNNKLEFGWTTSTSTQTSVVSTSTIPVGWVHLAVTVDSTNSSATTIYLGINGSVEIFTNNNLSTQTSTYGWNSIFGTGQYMAPVFTGNFTSLRWSSNLRYTSNYLLPSQTFVNDANTLFLFGQQNRFIDQSANNYTVSISAGTPRVTPFSPFTPVAYDPQVHGGSGYFDGSGDYVNLGNQSGLHLGSGDYTVELWMWKNTNTAYMTACGDFLSASTNTWQIIGDATGTKITWYNGASNGFTITSVASIPIMAWTHVAFVRLGNTLTLYINGVSDSSAALSTNYNDTTSFFVGHTPNLDASRYWNGYISGFRLVKGTAVYTSNFTPPSGPLPLISNTSLLLNFTNGGVIDSTGKNVIETVGNSGVVTTTIKKYGSGSMFFDATADQQRVTPQGQAVLGNSDWTVEFWAYANATPAGGYCGRFVYPNTGFFIRNVSGTVIDCGFNGSGVAITSASGVAAANTWQHIALAKTGNTVNLYVNGVCRGTTASWTWNEYLSEYFFVGSTYTGSEYFNGHIDDFRVTRGLARYTGSTVGTTYFTPPTKALPDRGTASTLTTSMAAPSSVEALVVAGGASGGGNTSGTVASGGGGAGGFREFVGVNSVAVSSNTNYAITIGAGGPATSGTSSTGSNGSNSIFGSIISAGGGVGGRYGNPAGTSGTNGGSGGGGGYCQTTANGSAGGLGNRETGTTTVVPTQGNNGGTGTTGASGGGGGAGGVGGNATNSLGGAGGIGLQSSITGISPAPYYAGGGGGGAEVGATGGAAGTGGGGVGATRSTYSAAGSGVSNTGGGGGGGENTNFAPGQGGSGVVILAYPTSFRPLKASLGLVYTIDTVTRPGYRVYKFTAGTGTVSW